MKKFKVKIVRTEAWGYRRGDKYRFLCPFCPLATDWDLSWGYVKGQAEQHLKDGHNVQKDCYKIRVKDVEL